MPAESFVTWAGSGTSTACFYTPYTIACSDTITTTVTCSINLTYYYGGVVDYNYPIPTIRERSSSYERQWSQQQAGWQHQGSYGIPPRTLEQQIAAQWQEAQRHMRTPEESMFNGERPYVEAAQPILHIPQAQPIISSVFQSAEQIALAKKKARALLLEFLDTVQSEELVRSNSFILSTGQRRYRIRPGDKVEEIDRDGRVLCRFCIHPSFEMRCPPDDWALTQMLLIESDEDLFRSSANRTAA